MPAGIHDFREKLIRPGFAFLDPLSMLNLLKAKMQSTNCGLIFDGCKTCQEK